MPENIAEIKFNALTSEHLKGANPIVACVETYDDKSSFRERVDEYADANDTLYVDFFQMPEQSDKKGIKSGGEQTYVISPSNELNKLSTLYKNCTGVVVTGQSKDTGKNISLLTHQNPRHFLPEGNARNSFLSHLRDGLLDLKEKCVPETVDAVIIGGNYPSKEYDDTEKRTAYQEKHTGTVKILSYKDETLRDKSRLAYLDSVKLLSKEISDVFGFEPVIITGPKGTEGSDCVFYENDSRHLTLVRPEVGNATTESFTLKDLEAREKAWSESE